jgi:hypothetical protein
MTTVSDFGTLEIKRLRVDEEISATRYGTEIMDKDMIFKVGDISNPNQSIRFSVHNGSEYVDAFTVDSNGFVVDDLNMTGPSSGVSAKDELVTLGEMSFQHFTDHANLRSGKMVFSLNNGDNDNSIVTVLEMTPEHTTFDNNLQVNSNLSCAICSSSILNLKGDPLKSTIATFKHPMSNSVAHIEKNYEGNIQFTGDVVSETNITESLSASHITCNDIYSKTCSVSTFTMRDWKFISEDRDLYISGIGSISIDQLNNQHLSSNYVESSIISAGAMFLPASGRVFEAGGVNIHSFEGSTTLTTPVLSVCSVLTSEFNINSDHIYLNNIRLDTSDGLRILEDSTEFCKIDKTGLKIDSIMTNSLITENCSVSNQSCDTMSCLSLSCNDISSRDGTFDNVSVNAITCNKANAVELNVTLCHTDTVRAENVTINNILSATGLHSDLLSTSHMQSEIINSSSLSCNSIGSSSIASYSIASHVVSATELESESIACDELTINGITVTKLNNALNVGTGLNAPVIQTSGIVIDSHTPLTMKTDDEILQVSFIDGTLVIPADVVNSKISASESVIGTISCSNIGVGNMNITNEQLGGSIRIIDGRHVFSNAADQISPVATMDIRGDGIHPILNLGEDSSNLTISVENSEFVVSSLQLVKFDCDATFRNLHSTSLSTSAIYTTEINDSGESCTIHNLITSTIISDDILTNAISAQHMGLDRLNSQSISTGGIIHTKDETFEVKSDDSVILKLNEDKCGINCSPDANLHVKSNENCTVLFESSQSSLTLEVSSSSAAMTTPHLLISTQQLFITEEIKVGSQVTAQSVVTDVIHSENILSVACDMHTQDVTSKSITSKALSVAHAHSHSLSSHLLVAQDVLFNELHTLDGMFHYSDRDVTIGDLSSTFPTAKLTVVGDAFQPAVLIKGITDTSMVLQSNNGVPRFVQFENSQTNSRWTIGSKNLPTEGDDVLGIYHSSHEDNFIEFDTAGVVNVHKPCIMSALSVSSTVVGSGGLSFNDNDYNVIFDDSTLKFSIPETGTINIADSILLSSQIEIIPTLMLRSEMNMTMHNLINLANPVNDNDAVNLIYLTDLLNELFNTEKVFTAPVYFAPPDETNLRSFGLGLSFTNAIGSVTSATRSFELLIGEEATDSFRFVRGGTESSVMMEFSPSGDININDTANFLSDVKLGDATISFDENSLNFQGLNTVISQSLGLGSDPQYRIHVRDATEDDIIVCQTSNERCRTTMETSDILGQAMITFSNTSNVFSTGYHSAFDAFVISSSNDLLQNTHLIIFRDSKQALFAGDIKLQSTEELSVTIEEDGQTVVQMNKSGIEFQNFGCSFDSVNFSISQQLGGVEIVSVLSTGENINGNLSVSGLITTGQTTLSDNDIGQFTCSSHTIFPSIETDEITLSDMVGFNVYKDSEDALRFADAGKGHVINYDSSEESITFGFSVAENFSGRGTLFVSDAPSFKIHKEQICVNTTTLNAALNVSAETGPQLSLINPSNANISAEMEVNDSGSVFFSSTQRSFNFDGDIYATSGNIHTNFIHIGDSTNGRWRIGVQDNELVVQIEVEGVYVTKQVFVA